MNKKTSRSIGLLAVFAIALSVTAAAAYASSAGSNQDPLVTLSYVEKRIQEVMTSVTAQIAESKGATGGSVSAPASVFQVVQVEKGSFVYFGGSVEFIVRSGKTSAITTANGGLSDLTDGVDIGMGNEIPANHHILVPRDDGRGFSALDTTFVLIKGAYTVTK